ncbi:DUF3117 domain-containing protein [Curtobacterium sp. MCPF17_052]|nr:DUF3117 domain-containing protein [Curtobacterium sp. MCPF17_052]WIB12046.1 DUF3117 domain-containing protein [Curtobacterium sp. MCPF17_052]
MTTASSAVPRARSPRAGRSWLVVRWRLLPWWLRITVVYTLSRVLTTALMSGFARIQTANSFTVQHPSYLSFASIWDGAWYRVIAASGYPSTLPIDAAGHVTENAWAFMPAYPFMVRALMTVTGASFEFVAVGVSLLAGWGAALVFRRLMGRFLDPARATFATVLFCVAPVSVVFQVAYAEAMGLLLLLVALLLLVQRRYWAMLPVVLLLGITRPTGLAFALLMGLFVVVGVLRPAWLRMPERLTVRTAVAPAIVAVVSGLVGLAWPAIAWAATGVPRAYTDTELAWRSSYIGWGGPRALHPVGAGLRVVVPPAGGHDPAGRGAGRLRRRGVPASRSAHRPGAPTVGCRVPGVPAGGVLPAVQHVADPAADRPAARGRRAAPIAGLPGRDGGPGGRPAVDLAVLLLVGGRVRLDAAVTLRVRSGSTPRPGRFRSRACLRDNGPCSYCTKGDNLMAAMKPRTGDGPMEAVKEGRLIIVRVPLEGGGRLVVSVNDAEAKELHDALAEVVSA